MFRFKHFPIPIINKWLKSIKSYGEDINIRSKLSGMFIKTHKKGVYSLNIFYREHINIP